MRRIPTLEQVCECYAKKIVKRAGGNKRAAVLILGISHKRLERLLQSDPTRGGRQKAA